MNEETPSDKPKATPKTRSPKAPATSTTTAKKTSSASTAEKKAPAVKAVAKRTATETDGETRPVRRRSASAKASTPEKTSPPAKLSPEERYRLVQDAAYFIAERDGFQGSSVDYWHRAEREIAQQLVEIGD